MNILIHILKHKCGPIYKQIDICSFFSCEESVCFTVSVLNIPLHFFKRKAYCGKLYRTVKPIFMHMPPISLPVFTPSIHTLRCRHPANRSCYKVSLSRCSDVRSHSPQSNKVKSTRETLAGAVKTYLSFTGKKLVLNLPKKK